MHVLSVKDGLRFFSVLLIFDLISLRVDVRLEDGQIVLNVLVRWLPVHRSVVLIELSTLTGHDALKILDFLRDWD